MHFLRRSAYHSLSVLLFIFLVLAAWTTAATLTFSKPDRLETWLAQSKLYDNFVDNALEQSQDPSTGKTNSTIAGVPLSDPQVQQAAKAAFSADTIQKAVDTLIDANYAWLQGKTDVPQFSIDLSRQKDALATNLASYAAERAVGLPRCKTLADVYQAEQDYLAATCIPVTVTPAEVGDAVKEDVATSTDFLANPVLTAQNLSSDTLNGNQQGAQPAQPYYKQLSSLPGTYRWTTRLPWITALLAVLSAAGLVFLASTRRNGTRRLGTLFVSAGAVILLLIFISSAVLHRLQTKLFTTDNVGQLQQSLVDFAHRAQSSLAAVDLWFGIGFIFTGIAIYLLLKFVWPTTQQANAETSESPVAEPPKPSPEIQS